MMMKTLIIFVIRLSMLKAWQLSVIACLRIQKNKSIS